jgi:hypothetical protein
MKMTNKLFNSIPNCGRAVYTLCKALKTPVVQTTAEQQLSEHPDFPSLLAVSDVLKNFGVENAGIKTEMANLRKYEVIENIYGS